MRNLDNLPGRLLSKVNINTIVNMRSYSFESDFYSYFKVGVEGLVVSSGQLANVSEKAFVGLEV